MSTATAPTALAADRADQSLGQIAVDLPGATALFRRLKLDFCCGGQTPLAQACEDAALGAGVLDFGTPLAQACEDKQLSLPKVLHELAQLDRPASEAVPQSANEMIDHILTRFHAVHREQLPELIHMARRVETVHRDNPHVPQGLSAHLDAMENELFDADQRSCHCKCERLS